MSVTSGERGPLYICAVAGLFEGAPGGAPATPRTLRPGWDPFSNGLGTALDGGRADQPHDHAHDPEILVRADVDDAELRILGHQVDPLAAAPTGLQRGVVADQGDHRVAVARVLLLADDDEVAVEDAPVPHALTLHAQREQVAAGEQVVEREVALDVLLGQQERARGDATDERNARARAATLRHARRASDRRRAEARPVAELAQHADRARLAGGPLDVAVTDQLVEVETHAVRGAELELGLDLADGRREAMLFLEANDEFEDGAGLVVHHGGPPAVRDPARDRPRGVHCGDEERRGRYVHGWASVNEKSVHPFPF